MTDIFDRMAEGAKREANEDEFEVLWKHWPDKRNKESARKAFKKLKPDERKKAAERAAEWCKEWRKDNPDASHIHCATYLNQKRFLDQDERAQASEETYHEMLRLKASWIAEEKHFLCKNIPSTQVEQMLFHRLVTPEQVRKVGL